MTVQASSTRTGMPDLVGSIATPGAPSEPPAPASRGWVRGALAVAILATFVRIVGLTREPAGDELYHILAAKQYLIDGTFRIHGGLYDRVTLFTRMVAWCFRLFGESVVAARLPAVLFGVLAPVLLFVWLRRQGLRTAAWVSAVLLALDPLFIELSQLSRFYTIQHFGFVLGVIAAYEAVEPGATARRRVWAVAVAVAALVLAEYCQVATLVGIGGLSVFLALVLWPLVLQRVPAGRRVWATIAVLIVAAAIGFLFLQSHRGQKMIALATYTDLWGQENRGNLRYYHWWFMNSYPVLWGLLPLMVAAAVAVRPRLALLAACVFGVPFVAHTLMAWKSPRYVAYAIPFFFIICGLAAERLVPATRRLLNAAAARIPLLAGRPRLRRAAIVAAGAAVVMGLVVTDSSIVQTIRNLHSDPSHLHLSAETPSLSWREAIPRLRPIADSAGAVVSTEDLEALYFLGRLDYVLDRDHLYQNGRKPEFAVDDKVGTPMVSAPSSLDRIIDCHRSGLLVAMPWTLRSYKMPPATAEVIHDRMTPVPLPASSGLIAFRWTTPADRLTTCPTPIVVRGGGYEP